MKTSIIILTYNRLQMTIDCLQSIERNTPEDHEIIVIDNGSTDGTLEYFNKNEHSVKWVSNPSNLGFAKGCNQGVEMAEGDNYLFLNNDTIVPPGWLTPMLQALYGKEDIGMVGPVTNYASGHQMIPVPYTNVQDMEQFAASYSIQNKGRTFEVRRLIGFCLLVKKSVMDEIGLFDERFGLGSYEDDDLCLRALRSGYRLVVAMDTFIHHIGHASMSQLPSATLQNLLQENEAKANLKWGAPIHSLIYSVPIRLGIMIMTNNDERTLEATLSSFHPVAEEIVIVDMNSTDRSVEIAKRYTNRIYIVKGVLEQALLSDYVQRLSSAPYVLQLESGDYLDSHNRRKLFGLKLSLQNEYDVISLLGSCGARYLFRKAAYADTSDWGKEEASNLHYRLNSGIRISHVNDSVSIN